MPKIAFFDFDQILLKNRAKNFSEMKFIWNYRVLGYHCKNCMPGKDLVLFLKFFPYDALTHFIRDLDINHSKISAHRHVIYNTKAFF